MPDQVALQLWAAEKVNQSTIVLEPLPGDASFRAYYRFKLGDLCYLLMDASKEKETLKSFVSVATEFSIKGLPVPNIFSYDYELGYVLLTDFGDRLLLNNLSSDNVYNWYGQAMQLLEPLWGIPQSRRYCFPIFDQKRILRELNTFNDWCLDKLLGLDITQSMTKLLNDSYAALVESALAQPQVIVHLDYHSRNLMIQKNNQLGIIDFQDAVIGPVTYDLVSLTKDCYVSWPSSWVSEWVNIFYEQAIERHVFNKNKLSLETFHKAYHWMGLQRHLKVLGVFSRLKLRDHKEGYIKDMPRVLNYILEVTQCDQALQSFHQFLEAEVQPRLEKLCER